MSWIFSESTQFYKKNKHFLQIGDCSFTVDGNNFTVSVMDSVKDYTEYMKEIFDFPAIKNYIQGTGGKPFNVLFNALHGGK